ncbi:exodeoxyribonuclease V subunit alpha [Alteromonas sp. CI.11.F.A3]|uniref:exodeoxyribonuclease V subunit alpha n=1 Tax=Alteromonas sp. CI.11.F.A3 TaxID=3079555 RepID=UPI00294203CC|nr:exodeoxyribonuclease V subunit alpha [Alteromonas sp. CI.11.F.A3]WOI39175.1 exodeoxyribonuclease V subunit alpha [Alteromonas sp. CI.11.F.A3]
MINSNEYLEQLFGIEAIDRFVALEFAYCERLTDAEQVIWLHLLVTLSFMQRSGHSCLLLTEIAGTRLFVEPESNPESEPELEPGTVIQSQAEPDPIGSSTDTSSRKLGYAFPGLTEMISVIKKALGSEKGDKNNKLFPLFVYQSGKLYSRRYYNFEQEIAASIANRTHVTALSEDGLSRVKALWPAMFPTNTTDEQDWQQIAVAKSLVQQFSVINGGPGTGKTYTVLRLLLALQACNQNERIVLAAPTGKAQQRMTESIVSNLETLRGKIDDNLLNSVPTDAVTLHRLLGLREHTIATRYNQQSPLMLDVLIVDEASMVDLALMARIIRALPPHARLYFIGDADQLPAVELGNVLEQLVHDSDEAEFAETGIHDNSHSLGAVTSELRQHIATLCPHLPLLPVNENAKTWVHTLQAPQRFKGQVAEVASAIQAGKSKQALDAMHSEAPVDKSPSEKKHWLHDGVFIQPESRFTTSALKKLAQESYEPVFKAQSAKEALSLLNRVRWLTPVRRGDMGVEGLNILVFDAIKHNIKRREGFFYQGQPIMIVKNNHPQRLSNGEVGIIWPDTNGKLLAWFETQDGGLRSISLSRVPAFETVFAMTIHKSQGSEFKYVVLLLPRPESEKAAGLFHRGLVYTGLTRAKDGCLVIANTTTFSAMVERRDKRFSGLSEAIKMRVLEDEERVTTPS